MALADVLYTVLLSTTVAAPPADRPEDRPALEARLRSIAEDAADVAGQDPEMATLILGVAHHESGFAIDVDLGPCRPGTCDNGQAACMLQIWTQNDATRAALFADRKKCFRTGLAALRSSMATCASNGPELQFAAYAAGSCDRGHQGSRELYAYWTNFRARWASADAKARKGATAPAPHAQTADATRGPEPTALEVRVIPFQDGSRRRRSRNRSPIGWLVG